MLINGNEFINRDKEREHILQYISESVSINKVLIIYAKSGIGKSSFCQTILNSLNEKIMRYKVKISHGEKIDLHAGFYIRKIAEEINKKSDIYGYQPLKKFLRNMKNSYLQKEYYYELAQELGEKIPGFSILSNIFAKNFNFDKYDDKMLFSYSENYAVRVFQEYITYILNSEKAVINIENIQDIDAESLLIFEDILSNTKNSCFILEYTIKESGIEAREFLENNFEIQANYSYYKCYKLEKIDKESFAEIMSTNYKSREMANNKEILDRIYMEVNGNLRELIDVEKIWSATETANLEMDKRNENFTIEHINSLNSDDRFILTLVAIHMSKVDETFLRMILDKNNDSFFFDLEKSLQCLLDESLITKNENYISIEHDYITTSILSSDSLIAARETAYNMWIDFYRGLLTINKTNLEYIKILVHLYARNDLYKNEFINFLPELKQIALNAPMNKQAIEYLNIAKNEIISLENNDDKEYFGEKLMEVFYELGLYSLAYSMFTSFRIGNSEKLKIYHVILLDILGRSKEAINSIEKYLSGIRSKRLEFNLLLVSLFVNASLNDYDACNKIYRQILNDENYKHYYEYGYFLRNSEIVLTIEESIDMLKMSAEFFKKYNSVHEAESLISLSMNLGRLGMIKEANESLELANNLLANRIKYKHIIYNNRAALKMCETIFSLELINTLKTANYTADSVFDKLIINKNILTILKKNNKYDEGEKVVKILNNLILMETNRLNICYTYWNISYFYKDHFPEKYRFYYNKYTDLLYEIGLAPSAKNYVYMPDNEFVIEFISLWQFDINLGYSN